MTNIVMLCRDRHRLLEQSLVSLYKNTPRDEFKLTLVDDGSEDFRTKKLLDDYGCKSNASLVRIENSSHIIARAKNLGVYWSYQTFGPGEWLYLSDSDVWFSPGWLGRMLNATNCVGTPGNYLFGGQIHPFHRPEPLLSSDTFTGHQVLDGPSWMMRWRTWRKVGPLRRQCASGPCQSEDAEWCGRLLAKGGRILVVRNHVVVHTGLTQTDGRPAPGWEERKALIPEGVLTE
jgi:glycosyltransferase involved in cell wall biosynthesis